MSENTVHLTESNFEELALRQDGVPVLIDFWADWCGPCRAMEPALEALAAELSGRAVIGKVNVDEEPALAAAARVQSIPTLVLLHNGQVADVMVGIQAKEKLKARIEQLTPDAVPLPQPAPAMN